MTFLIRRPMTRRGVLRGMSRGAAVAVALPFLDCFLNDNGTALASGERLPVRFGTWFWGLGHTPGRGISEKTPQIEFLEECKPLVPYQQHINYFSNFNTPLDGKPSAVHFTGWVGCRTGTVPRERDIPATTLDVLVSDAIGGGTRFRSVEVSSTGDPKDSYTFRNAGSQNAAEVSPIALYARLFGPDFVDPNKTDFKPDMRVVLRESVLSAIDSERQDLIRTLGSADKVRMDEYFTSLREIEHQLALETERPAANATCRLPPVPADGPLGVEIDVVVANHKVMSRLLAMAVACNQTKVFNMLYSQSLSMLRRRGEAFTHHTLTHEEPVDATLGYQREVAKLNVISMEAWATFIDAFQSIKEGDGTLLDNTLIFANTDTNFAKVHALDGVPVMTAGKAGGRIRTGIHVSGKGDPITRTGLTVMQVMGVPIERWGTGSLETSRPITEIIV